MNKLAAVRWMSIGLHTIVFLFALFLTLTVAEGDIIGALEPGKTDAVPGQALALSILLIV